MNEQERIELYDKAINLWGVQAQMMMVTEETGELLSAIGKFNRGRVDRQDVITEIADVAILMEQMGVVFGYDSLKAEIEKKLARLKERLDKSEPLSTDNACKAIDKESAIEAMCDWLKKDGNDWLGIEGWQMDSFVKRFKKNMEEIL